MANRVLRGTRIGRTSYETERNDSLAPRRAVTYRCPRGHEFNVPMADDAEVPGVWDCRQHGVDAVLISGEAPAVKPGKPVRTHWDMLLERRSVEELEELLDERLSALKSRRQLQS